MMRVAITLPDSDVIPVPFKNQGLPGEALPAGYNPMPFINFNLSLNQDGLSFKITT